MPTPRKHADHASRQAAYRARQAEALRDALAAKGFPSVPSIATIPGDVRWRAMIEQGTKIFSTVRDEMQGYHDERSERWQESEKGDELRAKIEALDELLSGLADFE